MNELFCLVLTLFLLSLSQPHFRGLQFFHSLPTSSARCGPAYIYAHTCLMHPPSALEVYGLRGTSRPPVPLHSDTSGQCVTPELLLLFPEDRQTSITLQNITALALD